MKVAFYAPMKPPDHPVLSGDREIARLLILALERAGHDVALASRLRSWMGHGSIEEQSAQAEEARTESERVLAALEAERPDIWITYHLYHKAPDWIGPAVKRELGVPYLVIEASRALKRRTGPWSTGFKAVDEALQLADGVAAMHAADSEGLRAVVPPHRLMRLQPFIDTAPYREGADSRTERETGEPLRLFTAAMMREGDKMASYRVLADVLRRLPETGWRLTIAGDGPMRDTVTKLFAGLPVSFLGVLEKHEMARSYARADLFVWPAVREAFGLVFMEAQAAGLPIIGGRSGGVPDVVVDAETGFLSAPEDAEGLAEAIAGLMEDPEKVASMSRSAAAYARTWHDIDVGSKTLEGLVTAAIANSRNGRP